MSIPCALNPLGLNHQNYFVLTVQPDAAHLTYSFTPNWDSGGFCRVDWGDGISENAVTSKTMLSHTYSAPGCYRIRIQGELIEINFALSADSGDIISDCNWNWRALGSLKRVQGTSNVKHQLNKTLTKLPESLTTLYYFAMNTPVRAELNGIPDGVVQLSYAFQICANFIVSVSKIPHGVFAIEYAFDRINTGSFFDLDSISENAPLNGWTRVSSIHSTFSCNTPGYSSSRGSIAGFMRKFPNVKTVTNAFTGFRNASGVTCFGENDYCSFTITTTDANQVWGFTPVSSAGRWYVFDWGDGTAETTNKNVDVFTSGSRVEHTFAAPGTYTVKLAMNASEIALDAYQATNGKWDCLGNPAHN